MPPETPSYTVGCSGCTRKIGISDSPTPLRNKVWCSAVCMFEIPIGQNEQRDALMTELSRKGRSDGKIAELFGVGRSRVQQIASARRAS